MARVILRSSVIASLLAIVLVSAFIAWSVKSHSTKAHAGESQTGEMVPSEGSPVAHVTVLKPIAGGVERTASLPGTIHAFEFEERFAKVPGFLIEQKVDIGSRVKKGQLLAQIDAPELVKEEEHAAARVEEVKAQVEQMEAHVREAEADLSATKTFVVQRQAEILRAKSNLEFRKKQYDRISKLAKQAAVDDNLVDEKFEQVESARSWRDATEAAVNAALADVEAKKAKVARAQADLTAAKASLKVAHATLEKAKVYVDFTKIRSHYDGVVTKRNFHNGDFIRAPDHGGHVPLFTIQRTDLMRLIVQVPDTDAPFADIGDAVDLFVSTLPGFKFPGLSVSRIANSQEERTRTMRVEIDVPNPQLKLRDGMYGEVTIHLQNARKDAFRVASSCLHRHEQQCTIRLVRDGHTCLQKVTVGIDNGHIAEILSGIRSGDLVIVDQPETFQEGVAAEVMAQRELISR